MQLIISPRGESRCLYTETFPLHELGAVSIRRGSHVEPDAVGLWWADLAPVDGPRLGPFPTRSLALTAEVDWLTRYWLPVTAAAE